MSMQREMRDYLRGEERIGYALGAVTLWSILFCGALAHIF